MRGRRGRRVTAAVGARCAHFCSCGQIVRGSVAKRQHLEVHVDAGDGHRLVTMERFRELFPDWRGGPQARQISGPNCTCATGEEGCPRHARHRC